MYFIQTRKVFKMQEILQTNIYELNTLSITLRLALAIILGGVVGIEREIDNKFAGLRTHMLVSVGATSVMITSQYIYEFFPEANFDIVRLGAQVISGIGFLGAGTILVTSSNHVSGLTTAAGLWVTAIIGLSLGIGAYQVAFITIFATLFVTIFLKPLKKQIVQKKEETDFTIFVYSVDGVRQFIKFANRKKAHLSEFNIEEESIYRGDEIGTAFHVSINLSGHTKKNEFIEELREVKGIKVVEPL